MFNPLFLENLYNWYYSTETFALITIISHTGSAPLHTGSMMIVNAQGESYGSISVGCLEGIVYDLALSVIHNSATIVETFAPDANPFAPQLNCGGSITISLEAISCEKEPHLEEFILALRNGKKIYRLWSLDQAIQVTPSYTVAEFQQIDPRLREKSLLQNPENSMKPQISMITQSPKISPQHPSTQIQLTNFALTQVIAYYPPQPLLLMIGANEYAAALSTIASFSGFRSEICDPRPAFAKKDHFPAAARVICQWPVTFLQETLSQLDSAIFIAICILSHDDKLDIDILEYLLTRPNTDHSRMYIGAIGSHATSQKRNHHIQARGIPAQELTKIHSPIGIDIGGTTPAETTISILSEIIYVRRKSGVIPHFTSLSDTTAPIHS